MKIACKSCGGGGIFLKLNSDGLCSKCAEKEKMEQVEAAKEYIEKLSSAVKIATANSVVLPSMGAEKIANQQKACDAVLEGIDKWSSFPMFKDAFTQTEIPYDEIHSDWKAHPLFPHVPFTKYNEPDFVALFDKLRKNVDDIKTKCIIAAFHAYDYDRVFHVVGVTFSDGKKSRQSAIRRLGKGYKDDFKTLSLRRHQFEGEDAVGVFSGDNQLGNISREDLPWLIEHWKEYASVGAYEVVGEDTLGLYVRACFINSREVE